jgi:DNA-binding CsgD family transcriptional regulator
VRGSSQVKALHAACVECEPGVRFELAPLLEELRRTLHAQNVAAYRAEPSEQGWDLALSCWVGPESAARSLAHQRFVQSSPADEPTFAAYDPFIVQRNQQNRALDNTRLFALEKHAEARHQRLYAALATEHTEQIRMLVCEGPRLLLWIGAMRDAPFVDEEVDLLQSLAEPLRARLNTQRQLDGVLLHEPMVSAMLDALELPALILTQTGKLEFLNRRARDLLERAEGAALVTALRKQVANKQQHPSFSLTPLRGCPGYLLATYSRDDKRLAQVVAHARTRWQLSARTTAFLEQLARGMSNKEIAARLSCAEVTVEKQLTLLFRSSGVRSRTELMAKLHAL